MKTAFAYWDKRIAPVFDTARKLRIVAHEAGRVVDESEEILMDDHPSLKADRLSRLGVTELVCGAISRPLYEMVSLSSIQVTSFVAGELDEVIGAWLGGKLDGDRFAMPGCCGRGRNSRFEECGNSEMKEERMNTGCGGGQGQGRGRKGGSQAGGSIGFCVCTKCGHREAHERGVPCVQRQCPKCGTALTRE